MTKSIRKETKNFALCILHFAFIMLFAFCISLVGVSTMTVHAADGDVNYLYCNENGTIWQTGTKAAGEYTPVTSSDTAWGTSGSETWYVASGKIEIGSRVTVNGTVNLILADDANLTINGGIAVNSGNTLIIWGQSGGTGNLTATINAGDAANYTWAAAIGGDSGGSGGVITIGGGTVTASCTFGAGIGGGVEGNGGNITIFGGTVLAQSANGAGIGGGSSGGNGGNITIFGGTVKALSNMGAGIGGGAEGDGSNITISGGTVMAAGGVWGAGIGGGFEGNGGNIIISGGTVTTTSEKGTGIGGGYEASSNGTLSSGENGSAIVQASNINADATSFVDYIEKSGASYTVHGSVTLSADLTIAEGETLTVPEDATLTVPEGVTLTNNGTLNCNSHSYKNGFCTICTSYEAATPVSDTHHSELNETHNGYYAIENAGQLYWFAQEVNAYTLLSANAVLTANIVVNEKVLDDDGSLVDDTAALRVWTPIGNAYFRGIFDGDGHTISGLYEGVLFYALDEGGTVKNVGVTNSYMIDSSYAACIAFMNIGIVENCWSDATVQTTGYYSGGLVGNNVGIISNCYNLGTTIGGTCVGAIAALNNTNASVSKCYFSNDNFGGNAVGSNDGFVDGLTGGKTAQQFASGEVAYLLGGDQTTIIWGQDIGTDAYPVLGGARVYYGYTTCAASQIEMTYTNNNAASDTKPSHTPEEDDGDCTTDILCSVCDGTAIVGNEKHSYTYTAVEHIIYEACSVCNTDGGVLELGWNTDNHVYDGNDKRVNIQKNTLVGKEIWDVDYRIDNSLTAVPITDAGTYTATASVGGATATMTFEILKATPSYTTPTGLAATYGDTLADIQLPPGFSWQAADTTLVGNAGNNTFLVTFTPEDVNNYNTVTDIEVTVAVGKKTITVTAESKEVEQFTALPEFTYTVDGMLDGDEFATAPVASVTIADTNTVGEYEITVSGGEDGNYEFSYEGAKLTVTEHTEHVDADENNACDECGAELPKDGLSGGAIAGIAVGSTAVAGLGGFSLFWFVIKKRKWADLRAVFKK